MRAATILVSGALLEWASCERHTSGRPGVEEPVLLAAKELLADAISKKLDRHLKENVQSGSIFIGPGLKEKLTALAPALRRGFQVERRGFWTESIKVTIQSCESFVIELESTSSPPAFQATRYWDTSVRPCPGTISLRFGGKENCKEAGVEEAWVSLEAVPLTGPYTFEPKQPCRSTLKIDGLTLGPYVIHSIQGVSLNRSNSRKEAKYQACDVTFVHDGALSEIIDVPAVTRASTPCKPGPPLLGSSAPLSVE